MADKIQQSYWSAVKDEILETGYGQYMAHQEAMYRAGYGFFDEKPKPDFNYSWVANNEGYEDYADYMIEHNIQSKIEHDIAKQQIDASRARKQRILNHDFTIMNGYVPPIFAAAVVDPITYSPMYITRGMSVIKAMTYGGASAGTAVGISEAVRHAYDPTATSEQSLGYVGGATVFGGLFSGIMPAARYIKYKKAEKKIEEKYVEDDVLIEDYLDAHQKDDGGVPIDFDIQINNLGKTITRKETGPTGAYIDENNNVVNMSSRRARRKNLEYSPVRYRVDKSGKEFVDVDDTAIKILYQQFRSGVDILGIGTKYRDVLDSEKKFADFMVRREVYRQLYPNKKKGRSYIENEQAITDEVIADAIRFKNIDFTPDYGQDRTGAIDKIFFNVFGRASKALGSFNPLDKASNFSKKDKKLYIKVNMGMHRLIGDYGMRNKFADRGIVIDRSVLMNRDLKWGHINFKLSEDLKDSYMMYINGSEVSKTLTTEGNTSLVGAVVNATKAYGGKGLVGISGDEASRASAGVRFKRTIDKAKEKILRNKNKTKNEKPKMTEDEFNEYVTELRADPEFYSRELNEVVSEQHRQAIEMAIAAQDRFYKAFDEEIVATSMYANSKNAKQMKVKIDSATSRLKKKIKQGGTKDQIELWTFTLDEYNKFGKALDDVIDDVSTATPKGEIEGSYFQRIYDVDNVIEYRDVFAEQIVKPAMRDKYTFDAVSGTKVFEKFKTSIKNKIAKQKLTDEEVYELYLDELADETIDNIINKEAQFMDSNNIMDLPGDKKPRPLMRRSLEVPNKSFLKVDTKDGPKNFIYTDANELAKHYRQQVGTAIEMTKEFGDKNGNMFKLELMEEMADAGKFTLTEANGVYNNFTEQVNAMYGLYNYMSPDSFSKRTIEVIRNYTSLTTMGNVAVTSLTELARPIAMHGFLRVISEYPASYNALSKEMREAIIKDQSWLYTHMELLFEGGGSERIFGNDLGATTSQSMRILGMKVPNARRALRSAQKPFYYMNGLTQLTAQMKEFQKGISAHRFIEDMLKFADGTLDNADIDRLLSYGISKKTARAVKKLYDDGVIQTVSKDGNAPLFLANVGEWSNTKSGAEALRVFRQALKADVDRAIVTPNLADKNNMMYGKMIIDSENFRKFISSNNEISQIMKGLFKVIGGDITQLKRGVAINLPHLVLITQFYAWGIAANRKILASSLAKRERNYAMYASTAVALSMAANGIKYGLEGKGFDKLTHPENVLLAVENSGILGIFTDVNRMVENISGGESGIRPAYDLPFPFQDEKDAYDAYGQVGGAGPSKIADIFRAFSDDDEIQQKYAIRRNLPLQNLGIHKAIFSMISSGLDLQTNHYYDPILDTVLDIENRYKKRETRE